MQLRIFSNFFSDVTQLFKSCSGSDTSPERYEIFEKLKRPSGTFWNILEHSGDVYLQKKVAIFIKHSPSSSSHIYVPQHTESSFTDITIHYAPSLPRQQHLPPFVIHHIPTPTSPITTHHYPSPPLHQPKPFTIATFDTPGNEPFEVDFLMLC